MERIRVVGFIDEIVEVNSEMYNAAEAAGNLASFMHPILLELDIELTFGRLEEIDGNSL